MPRRDAAHAPDVEAREPSALGRVRLLRWLASACVLAAIASLLSSVLPARLRLLGVTAVAIGLLVGWLAGISTVSLRFHYPRRAYAAGTLVGIVAFGLTTVLWWRAHVVHVKDTFKAPPKLAYLSAAQQSTDDPAMAKQLFAEFSRDGESRYREEVKRRTRFTGYLTHRSSAIHAGSVMAWFIWCIELGLAGVAAGRVAGHAATTQFCDVCQNWMRLVREQRFTGQLPDVVRKIAAATDLTEIDAGVTVWMRTCDCTNRLPRVEFEFDGKRRRSESHVTVDLTSDQLRELNRAIDAAQNLSAPENDSSANLRDAPNS